ncbi:toxin [Cellulomonas hominis]
MPAPPRPPASPRRFRIVGNSGSGKTTLARQMAERLGLGHLELDEAFWGPDWQKRAPEDGRATVRAFVASPAAARGWVMDGNWNDNLGELALDVDLIVWLDFPRRTVVRRVLRRTLARVVTRTELWHGNRERWRNLLRRDPAENIVRWAWTEHAAYRARYAALAVSGQVEVLRLDGPRAAREWLDGLS